MNSITDLGAREISRPFSAAALEVRPTVIATRLRRGRARCLSRATYDAPSQAQSHPRHLARIAHESDCAMVSIAASFDEQVEDCMVWEARINPVATAGDAGAGAFVGCYLGLSGESRGLVCQGLRALTEKVSPTASQP